MTVAAPESLPVLETLLEAVKRPLARGARRGRARTRARDRPGARAVGREAGARPAPARSALPAVVDADALFELEPVERPAPTVLTPHAGELGRLLGRESPWVAAHRLAAVARGGRAVRLRRAC